MVEGVAGKSYQGDIAVDDMKLIKSPCPLPGKSVTSKTMERVKSFSQRSFFKFYKMSYPGCGPSIFSHMERVFDLEMVEPITEFKTHDYLPF